MNIGDAVWREARDGMGRSVWINLSLARSIRRDPTGRCTWVTFDKEHSVAVDDRVDDLMAGATTTLSATRPRNFYDGPTRVRGRTGQLVTSSRNAAGWRAQIEREVAHEY
jgi:hypothetical protein